MKVRKKIALAAVVGLLTALLLALGWTAAHQEGDTDALPNRSEMSGELPPDGAVGSTSENGEDDVDILLEELMSQYQEPALVSRSATAQPGEEVTVPVIVVNNPGILGMSATLSYDESAMTLVGVRNGAAFDVLSLTVSGSLKNGCRFLWDGLDITPDQVRDGEILQLVFQIHEDAKGGKYPVALILDEGGTVDRDLNQFTLTVDCGYITVNE